MFATIGKSLKNNITKVNVMLKSGIVSGPPRNRIPFPEKVANGVAISCGILAIPAWILFHLDDYKKRD